MRDEAVDIAKRGPQSYQLLNCKPEPETIVKLEYHEGQLIKPAELSISYVVLSLTLHYASIESRDISSQLHPLSLLNLDFCTFFISIYLTLLIIIFFFAQFPSLESFDCKILFFPVI